MKKSLLILSIILLVISCSSRNQFHRKQYNNRYYISMSKTKKLKKNDHAQDNNLSEIKSENLISDTVEHYKFSFLNDSSITIEIPDNPKNKNNLNETMGKKTYVSSLSDSTLRGNEFSLKYNEWAQKKITKPSMFSDENTLSLFWIVVVIILIIWVIGAFTGGFGIGGAIHLLLILALILLILWLLGIL